MEKTGVYVLAFVCMYTGPKPSVNDVYMVGVALVRLGETILSSSIPVQPRGEDYVFLPELQDYMEGNTAIRRQIEAGRAGLTRAAAGAEIKRIINYANDLVEAGRAEDPGRLLFVIDLPLDAAFVESLLGPGESLYLERCVGKYVGGPRMADAVYRAHPSRLDDAPDPRAPRGTEHNAADDAREIATRVSRFLDCIKA